MSGIIAGTWALSSRIALVGSGTVSVHHASVMQLYSIAYADERRVGCIADSSFCTGSSSISSSCAGPDTFLALLGQSCVAPVGVNARITVMFTKSSSDQLFICLSEKSFLFFLPKKVVCFYFSITHAVNKKRNKYSQLDCEMLKIVFSYAC
jgi:hypothetical protein